MFLVKITQKAIAQMIKTNRKGIYIYTEPGGCAEYKFGFTFEVTRCKEPCLRFDFDGVFVVSDAVNKDLLDYVEIDYKTSLVSQKFVANVNKEIETCSCGISYKNTFGSGL